MTQRLKTIEYAFAFSQAGVASSTARDFTQIAALAIPESTTRTFRSVILEVSFDDVGIAAGSMTACLLGIALGAVARNDVTVTQTITNSGENQAFVVTRDVTSYFVTNYTGTTMTADCRLTVTNLPTGNASAKLIITYEYDDASATTRIKTVKIPIDGNTGNLTTGFTKIGGFSGQWPLLDTFLPERSKVYRDIFFQIDGHTGTTATANSQLRLRFNGVNTPVDHLWSHQLNSDCFFRHIEKLNTIATNSSFSTEASVTSTGSMPMPCINGYIAVTYEYNHSTSGTMLNSIQIPIMEEAGWMGGTATGDKSRFSKDIFVEEPTPIALVQSGIQVSYIDAGAVTLDFRTGSQAARVFTQPASQHCGGMTSMRRIDSGGAGGVAGMTLAHGKNTIVIDWFTNSASVGNLGSNMSGLLFLNYTSGKHANGDGVHAHTTAWCIRPFATGGLVQRLQAAANTTPIIPEANYWLVGAGYQIIQLVSGTASAMLAFSILCEVQSGEAEGAGWRDMYTALYSTDSEIGPSVSYGRARDDFKRFPADPDTSRLDIETARDYRYDVNVNSSSIWQMYSLVTYHAITYAISGTVSGSGGGTVNISAWSKLLDFLVGTTSRSGNGSYSITWYDDTASDIVVEAREDATHVGRSDDGTAA